MDHFSNTSYMGDLNHLIFTARQKCVREVARREAIEKKIADLTKECDSLVLELKTLDAKPQPLDLQDTQRKDEVNGTLIDKWGLKMQFDSGLAICKEDFVKYMEELGRLEAHKVHIEYHHPSVM